MEGLLEEVEELSQLLESAESKAADCPRWKQEAERLQAEQEAASERHAGEITAMEETLREQEAHIAGNIAQAMQAVQEAQQVSGLQVDRLQDEKMALEASLPSRCLISLYHGCMWRCIHLLSVMAG